MTKELKCPLFQKNPMKIICCSTIILSRMWKEKISMEIWLKRLLIPAEIKNNEKKIKTLRQLFAEFKLHVLNVYHMFI